jgi:hypothetical protein
MKYIQDQPLHTGPLQKSDFITILLFYFSPSQKWPSKRVFPRAGGQAKGLDLSHESSFPIFSP